MSELRKRVISGAIGVALLMASILFSHYTYGLIFLVIAVMVMWEYYSLLEEKEGIKPQKYFGIFIGIIVFSGNFIFAEKLGTHQDISLVPVLYIIPLVFLFFLFELFKKSDTPFTNISFSLSGVIYIAFPFALMHYIVMFPDYIKSDKYYHPEILIGFLFVLWANDSGGFFAGRKYGKHKLFERVSPKKTWEGFIGGLLFSLVMAAFIALFFTKMQVWEEYGGYSRLELIDWLILAVIIAIFGTLGDLVESHFKRGLGIKDSGNILPGHGGVLDRFDSLVLSTPFVFTYIKIFA